MIQRKKAGDFSRGCTLPLVLCDQIYIQTYKKINKSYDPEYQLGHCNLYDFGNLSSSFQVCKMGIILLTSLELWEIRTCLQNTECGIYFLCMYVCIMC